MERTSWGAQRDNVTSTAELPQPGATLGGKYRIERMLAEGMMGVVYEALHVKLGQQVAVKLPRPTILEHGELVDRFEREARAAAQLRHRNTARVLDVDTSETGIPYLVMELLHGHDLETEISRRGALPVEEAVGYVLQACAAMHEAHGRGIVHRDLKPSNMFLAIEPDDGVCLKILDFGISKFQSEDVGLTMTEVGMGTPLYMSPEQVRSAKDVDQRTDVWSLGVILYELLTGQTPFNGSEIGIGAAIIADEPIPLRELRHDVPPGLAAVVAKAMAKARDDRFGSMAEMMAALTRFSASSIPLDLLRQSHIGSPTSRGSRFGVKGSAPASGLRKTEDPPVTVSLHAGKESRPMKPGFLLLVAALVAAGIVALVASQKDQSPEHAATGFKPVDGRHPPPLPTPDGFAAPSSGSGMAGAGPSGLSPLRAASSAGARTTSEQSPSNSGADDRAHVAPRPHPAAPPASPPRPAQRAGTSFSQPINQAPEPPNRAWDNDSPLPPR